MSKVRLKATMVRFYYADSDNYGTDDPLAMAQIDMEADDPFSIMDDPSSLFLIEPAPMEGLEES